MLPSIASLISSVARESIPRLRHIVPGKPGSMPDCCSWSRSEHPCRQALGARSPTLRAYGSRRFAVVCVDRDRASGQQQHKTCRRIVARLSAAVNLAAWPSAPRSNAAAASGGIWSISIDGGCATRGDAIVASSQGNRLKRMVIGYWAALPSALRFSVRSLMTAWLSELPSSNTARWIARALR